LLSRCFAEGGKLLLAGNGGSASDADHMSGELLKGFVKKRKAPDVLIDKIKKLDEDAGDYLCDKLQGGLPVIALPNNSAVLTASLNDVDGNVVYAQQVNVYGSPGDVFLGISTSGNSKNIYYAMLVAKVKGLKTILMTGKLEGIIAGAADCVIRAPETETYKIQELHLPVYHALCLMLEDCFF
jgi:D-sedoheptulose 7-phosphate isomerase